MTSLADETRFLDACGQAELVRTGQVSPRELVEAAISRIEALNPPLNALTFRWFEDALAAAGDPALADGPLRGVPFLLKDLNAPYAGQPMSDGNRRRKELATRAATDSTLVARHRAAGLITLGRTASPEWGSIAVTESSAWGATRNPWNTDRSAGGSSGGAGAAVSAGMVPIAHASDGGGSIRIPASACGLVGLKVSQGRITMGPFGMESGLSVHHAVTRTVRDTAALLDATHGPGIGDTVIAPPPARPYAAEVGADPGRLRIGLLDRSLRTATDPACTEAAVAAAGLLEKLGHHVEPAWPAVLGGEEINQGWSDRWWTDAAVDARELAELLGRPLEEGDIEPVNRAMVNRGDDLSAAEYAEALSSSARVRRQLHAWWSDGWDLLLTPTMAIEPLPIGLMQGDVQVANASMARCAVFTSPFNTSGQPAISLPMHWTAAGLPIGVQLAAAYGREDVLIRVASQLEAAAPWAGRTPPAAA